MWAQQYKHELGLCCFVAPSVVRLLRAAVRLLRAAVSKNVDRTRDQP